jgi:Lon-like protease
VTRVATRSRLLRLFSPVRVLSVGVLLVIVVIALEVVSSNDYIFLPDRAHPVAPLVTVAGGHEPHNGGGIYFVDVIVRKATVLEELLGGLHSGSSLYPASEIVPPGVSGAQEDTIDLSEMKTSQQIAAAVALRALGRKVTTTAAGAVIDAVEPGFPAADKLEPTDVIVAIDGAAVHTPADVTREMAGRAIGATVRFTIVRNGKRRVISLKTVPASHGSKRAIVGIELDASPNETIHLPIHVSIDAHGVGGPSAGLAFALEVMQQLGRNVDRGNKIAATGEIFADGQVGAIGGIEQKTIGAREAGVDAFLVPAGQNAIDARKYAHGLRIIPVKSFQQALHALATLPQSP